MKGLIVKQSWIDMILDNQKSWEIRGSNTKIRDRMALIQSGTGLILVTINLANAILLTLDDFQKGARFHCIKNTEKLPYKKLGHGY